MNPYESPQICDAHQHKMPIWLKRFLTTCAIIGAVVLTCDAIYVHIQQNTYGTSYYRGDVKEIVRELIERDYWSENDE